MASNGDSGVIFFSSLLDFFWFRSCHLQFVVISLQLYFCNMGQFYLGRRKPSSASGDVGQSVIFGLSRGNEIYVGRKPFFIETNMNVNHKIRYKMSNAA